MHFLTLRTEVNDKKFHVIKFCILIKKINNIRTFHTDDVYLNSTFRSIRQRPELRQPTRRVQQRVLQLGHEALSGEVSHELAIRFCYRSCLRDWQVHREVHQVAHHLDIRQLRGSDRE